MPTPKKAFFIFLIACLLPAALFAQSTIRVSTSSQISEAFGRVVVENFQETTGLEVNLHVFSSQVAITRLKNGVCDLATSALKLTSEQRKSGLVEIPICTDPMVVIASRNIPVEALSLKEVRRLFSGYITNWNEVGGPDLPVCVVTPIQETAAYANFEQQAMGASQMKFDYQAAKASAAVTAVIHIPGAITFATRSVTSKYPDIRTFTIDGISPDAKEYPYVQTFSFVTNGQPSGVVREVINHALSEKARANFKTRGLTPLVN